MDALFCSTVAAWSAFAAAVAWHVAETARTAAAAGTPRAAGALPLSFRALLPFARPLLPIVEKPFFARRRAGLEANLAAAGLDDDITAQETIALGFLCPVFLGLPLCGAIALAGALLPGAIPGPVRTLAFIAIPVLMAAAPGLWVRGAVKKRALSISKALPFVLDLLTLSVEAGLDFMAALQRACGMRKRDALNEELSRMTREIQLGATRRKALRNMADRTRHPDLKAVSAALIQADELGVSIGAILRIQSDQMRSRRFERAEKLANEAPVKMLGPLMLCIFPAVFLILLGPVMAKAAHGLF